MTSVPVNHVELESTETRDCVTPLCKKQSSCDDVLDDIWRDSWSDDEDSAPQKKRLTAVSIELYTSLAKISGQ